MNERYGRNDRSDPRGRYGARDQDWRDQDWNERDRQDYDQPRQQQQWHDESRSYGESVLRSNRGAGQMGGQQGSYGGASQDDWDRDDGDWSSPGSNGRRDHGAQRSEWQSGYGAQGHASQGRYPSREQGQRGTERHEAGRYQGSDQAPQRSMGSYGAAGYGSSQRSDFASFTGNDYGGRDFSAGHGGYGGSYSSGYGQGYGSSSAYGGVGGREYASPRDTGPLHTGEDRGLMARAGDEIASWFGDDDAARRREMDHRGRGPANYTRSDERIREDASDHLTRDASVDASNITVSVDKGEVTLSGTVTSRFAKRRAEDCVDHVSGVKHVQNNLRVQDSMSASKSGTGHSGTDQSAMGHTGPATGTTATATGASTAKSGSTSTPR